MNYTWHQKVHIFEVPLIIIYIQFIRYQTSASSKLFASKRFSTL